MVGIILVGHGNFATGLSSAARLVFGELEKFQAIDFTEDVTPDQLAERIEVKIKEYSIDDGVLILSDIAGGTPFKTSSLISLKYDNVKVLAGINLPLLLESLSERDGYIDLDDAMNCLVKTGKEEIRKFEMNSNKKETEEVDEGI